MRENPGYRCAHPGYAWLRPKVSNMDREVFLDHLLRPFQASQPRRDPTCGSAGIPSGIANVTRRIAKTRAEQAIEMGDIRKADLERDIGDSLLTAARFGQQLQRFLQQQKT